MGYERTSLCLISLWLHMIHITGRIELPEKPKGYYKEYTVDTPGATDRGVRRIVTGKDGEKYYTENHYATFRKIEE